MNTLDLKKVREIVSLALREDIGTGDITTDSIIPKSSKAKGEIIANKKCVVAGLPVAKMVFEELDSDITFVEHTDEGNVAYPKEVIAEVSGSARAILTGERTALNFLQHLSGIATYTWRFIEKARKYGVIIKDTRKTIPGLRYLEKYAVNISGGENHRMGLYDMAMIKDNHLKLINEANLVDAVKKIRKNYPNVKIEIEAETLAQVKMALKAGADIIMLDNMDNEMIGKAVKIIDERAIVEASGRMTTPRIEGVARQGVNWISVGAITASARSVDISLELKQWT